MRVRRGSWALLAFALGGPLATGASGQSQEGDLRAENVDVRRAAAARLRTAGKDALPAMIDLLMKEKDGQVRLSVLDAVAALGPDAADAVPALVHTLKSDYGGQRLEEFHQDYRSALALAAIGKPSVEPLRELLKDKDRKENVRAEAAMALGRIGPDAADAVPDLVPLLGDKSERLRHEASVALGGIGPAAVGPLADAANGNDVPTRVAALDALGGVKAPDDQARRTALEHAADPSPEARSAALRSLAKFDLPEDALKPALKDNLGNANEEVRLAVVDLLVARPPLLASLSGEIEPLLASTDEGVSRHAAFLLGKLGPDAAPRLLDALPRDGVRVDQVAGALAQIGRPVADPLLKALASPEPRVRRGAALALGRIRPLANGTVPALTAGLADPDSAVRADFLTAVGELGPRAREAVPAVRTLLTDGTAEIRAHAIDVLAGSAPRDARMLDDLTARLDDDAPTVQRRAIDTIRALGPLGRKALPTVVAKLNGDDKGVRLAAAEFIGSHGAAASDAVPALAAMLDDPSPETQMVAAQTLGKLGKASQPAFERLSGLLGSDKAEVRGAAAATLGSLGMDADALRPHIAKALQDSSADVRKAAMAAIQKLGPQGAIFVPDLIELSKNSENRTAVTRALRRFERRGPDARSLPELVKQLDSDQDNVRLLAIKFLGLAGRNAREAIPALERLRDASSPEVRKQAEAACEKIKSDPPAAAATP